MQLCPIFKFKTGILLIFFIKNFSCSLGNKKYDKKTLCLYNEMEISSWSSNNLLTPLRSASLIVYSEV